MHLLPCQIQQPKDLIEVLLIVLRLNGKIANATPNIRCDLTVYTTLNFQLIVLCYQKVSKTGFIISIQTYCLILYLSNSGRNLSFKPSWVLQAWLSCFDISFLFYLLSCH